MEQYPLYYNGKPVGSVLLHPQGRFYDLSCRFQLKTEMPMHLYVKCDKANIDLGLCVPYGKELGMKRCLPQKQLGAGERQFYICSAQPDGRFTPLYCDRPFPRMTELIRGRFEMQLGVPGILFDRD